jgi:Fe2+ transport system protein FeoA
MLRYLGERGIVPETEIAVRVKAPGNGPLTVRRGKRPHLLGPELARQIQVMARRTA